MDPYMLIYRTEEDWPITGKDIQQKTFFFLSISAAHSYRDKLVAIYPKTLTDVQIYE